MFSHTFPRGFDQWQRLVVQLHDLIFPARCVSCQTSGCALCDRCAQQVIPATAPLCVRCGRLLEKPSATCVLCRNQPDAPLRVRAAAVHTGVMRDAIHALKYDGVSGLAPSLARYLVAAWQDPTWDDIRRQVTLVAPVPLHAERLRERGYNQSALLAAAFCRRSGLRCEADSLVRVRATQSQVGLDARARAANVADAFSTRMRLDGTALLLIDDVYTTGSTLAACSKAAYDAGAQAVFALALALPARHTAEPTAG